MTEAATFAIVKMYTNRCPTTARPAAAPTIMMMKKILLSVAALLASALAPVSCERESAEYGDDRPPVGTTDGTLSLGAMSVALSADTETIDAVVRPDGATAANATPERCRAQRATRAGARYDCVVTDAAGTAVAEFAYDRRPETLSLPSGAYTLTVSSAEMKSAAWDAPVYIGRHELLVDRNTPLEVGKVLCTPAAVAVSLAFDATFGARSTVTVGCGGERLVFTPAESRTAYFTVGEARTLTLEVDATSVDGMPIAYTRRYTDVQPGQEYRVRCPQPIARRSGHRMDRPRHQAALPRRRGSRRPHPRHRTGRHPLLRRADRLREGAHARGAGVRGSAQRIRPHAPRRFAGDARSPGIPHGDAVTDRSEVLFDITQFMGLIPLLGSGDSDFVLTVIDNEGQPTTETVMVYSTDEEEPAPDGPAQEYPGGEAKPIE